MKDYRPYPIACYQAEDIVLQAIKANLQGDGPKTTTPTSISIEVKIDLM